MWRAGCRHDFVNVGTRRPVSALACHQWLRPVEDWARWQENFHSPCSVDEVLNPPASHTEPNSDSRADEGCLHAGIQTNVH